MASTTVVDLTNVANAAQHPQGWGVAAPQVVEPEAHEYDGSMTLIDEIYIELTKEGITREYIYTY